MKDKKIQKVGLSSFSLHLVAMALMLCDHLWATVVPGNDWLTWLGRLAFPIFAFLIAEGYSHTRNLRRYRRRLLVGAVLSEIPFNLIYAGSWFYPFQQNVLWTFWLALCCMETMDKLRTKYPLWKAGGLMVLTAAGYFLAAQLAMVDYFGYGVLTVLVFWLFRGRGWKSRLGQLMGLTWIHWEMMGGLVIPVTLGGLTLAIPQQGFAVLALLPIWSYGGSKGYNAPWFRGFCYGFYPVHMLILGAFLRIY